MSYIIISPVQIDWRDVEKNRKYHGVIKLQYEQKESQGMDQQDQTLKNCVDILGLMIADDPVFINLLIDTSHTYTSHHTSADSKPNLQNLMFTGKDGTRVINVAEEISDKFFEFGVQLLNDTSGAYVRSIDKRLRGDCTAINREILKDWICGRCNAHPHTWADLIETLKSVNLNRLADEIKEKYI